jgi:hypothetical protein
MKNVLRIVRKWWWVIILALGTVGWILWKVFGPRDSGAALPAPPKFLDMARAEVERVHLEGEVEKAKVRTEATGQMKQIEAIEEKGKKDPAAARRDLADFLSQNL